MNLVQVTPRHYESKSYDVKSRFISYWHQIQEVLARDPSNVLEIGLGNGFFSNYLRRHGVDIVSTDIDPSLKPDLVASVDNLPFSSGKFDIVVAFQVLEHLPFERFNQCIAEMVRVSHRYLIISLPDRRPFLNLLAGIYPAFAHRLGVTLPAIPRMREFDGEHYWEIGWRGYPYKRIRNVLESNELNLEHHYRIPEKPLHHLFILKKQLNER